MEIGMKIINVGLSVLISVGLAISPIHANEFDVADESNKCKSRGSHNGAFFR